MNYHAATAGCFDHMQILLYCVLLKRLGIVYNFFEAIATLKKENMERAFAIVIQL